MESNCEFIVEKFDIGWIVERYFEDGDVVFFNCQLLFYRMFIMVYCVRVMLYRIFCFNLLVCLLYNVDFDGDEMNFYVLQIEEVQVEVKIFMEVQNYIIFLRYGGLFIVGIQDYIFGGYFFIREGVYFICYEVEQMFMFVGMDVNELFEFDKYENGELFWSGKMIFFFFFLDDLMIWYRNKFCDEFERCEVFEKFIEEKFIFDLEEVRKFVYDGFVYIQNGKFLSGVVDKKVYGREDGKFFDIIVREYGVERVRQFFDQVIKLIIWVIIYKGFIIVIDDEDFLQEVIDRIYEIICEVEEKVQRFIEVYKRGEFEFLLGKIFEEIFESKIMVVFVEVCDNVGKVVECYFGMNNYVVIMVKIGVRGKIFNIIQMVVMFGQQFICGKCFYCGYCGRVFIYFKLGDFGVRVRGFVMNLYKSGLILQEYFFYVMGGREGFVDIVVRIVQSGYMQRRFINVFQDFKVDYDGMVRDLMGIIVQFKYGEDGVDLMKSWQGKIVDVDRVIVRILFKMRGGGE